MKNVGERFVVQPDCDETEVYISAAGYIVISQPAEKQLVCIERAFWKDTKDAIDHLLAGDSGR